MISILAAVLTNFGGHWVGTGFAHDKSGWQAKCDQIEFQSTQTEEVISIHSGNLRCGNLKTTWRPHQVQIRGNELWFNGEKIGTIAETHVHTESISANSKIKQVFDFEIQGEIMLYNEIWTDLSGSREYLSIQGQLERIEKP
ncbi:MAG: hypothetical protein BroJett040_04550 [Oligoflexia bacterium]|nr:MAG: hypothetical protein BroJett040_04550 [Oligoflexia bacterium]